MEGASEGKKQKDGDDPVALAEIPGAIAEMHEVGEPRSGETSPSALKAGNPGTGK